MEGGKGENGGNGGEKKGNGEGDENEGEGGESRVKGGKRFLFFFSRPGYAVPSTGIRVVRIGPTAARSGRASYVDGTGPCGIPVGRFGSTSPRPMGDVPVDSRNGRWFGDLRLPVCVAGLYEVALLAG